MTKDQIFKLNIQKISEGIKLLMKQDGGSVKMTQDSLALYADVYPYQVSKLLSSNGEYNPNINTISNIISVFDMDLEEFFVWYNNYKNSLNT